MKKILNLALILAAMFGSIYAGKDDFARTFIIFASMQIMANIWSKS